MFLEVLGPAPGEPESPPLSRFSPGLFTRVAAMSGCSLAPWSIQSTPLKAAKKLGAGLRCPLDTSHALVQCLRKVSAEALNEVGIIDLIPEPRKGLKITRRLSKFSTNRMCGYDSLLCRYGVKTPQN